MSKSISKSEKAQWQEKKKHGSKKEQRAAISVQIGRITEKLYDRAEGLGDSQYRFPYRKSHRHGYTIISGTGPYDIESGEKTYKSDFWQIPHKGKEITVRYVGPEGSSEHLRVDPTGKHRPSDSMSERFRVDNTTWVLAPSPEDMVKHAAPTMRHIKNEIDTSEKIKKAA